MAILKWDQTGERRYETGVDHGVLYLPNAQGVYDKGYAWNGLITVSEKPSGAEANAMYADNIKYLNLMSAEDFSASIEAFTYPDEFMICDGTKEISPGVLIGQQNRSSFGLAYRTKIGNDVMGSDAGYKLHLVYNALAAPTEKAYNTINESPEAITFNWEMSTTAVEVPGNKPSATIILDSTKVPAAKMAEIEGILFGTVGTNPRLPTPTEIVALFSGVNQKATPVAPTAAGNVITIPTTVGVRYLIDGVAKTGTVTITKDTVVTAVPAQGYTFPTDVAFDDDWLFKKV